MSALLNQINISSYLDEHYSYFLDQNDKIAAKNLSGIHLNLEVLGVGDGLTVCNFCWFFAHK